MSSEEALEFTEVDSRLERALSALRHAADNLVARAAACAALFPYSVRFPARALFLALRRAGASEREALRAASALVVTHFLVPSVEDPSLCGIVDFEAAEAELRGPPAQTLALVAKVSYSKNC